MADLYWADDRAVNADAGVVANGYIPNSIVDAAERFYHALLAQ